MKILIITPRFHTNLYYRVKGLEKQGHEVLVAYSYKGKSEYTKNCRTINIGFAKNPLLAIAKIFKRHHLQSRLERFMSRPSKKRIQELIKKYNPDNIYIKSYLNMYSLTCIHACKSSAILTQTRKNTILGSKLFLKIALQYMKAQGVKKLISPIEFKKNFPKIIPLKTAPFVFPEKKYTKEWFPKKTIRILCIGKFIRRKDQLRLLHALNKMTYKYTLTIAGEEADKEYLEEIKKYIEEKNIPAKIRTNIPYQSCLELYKEHDLFVLPSYGEPAAYSIVEAMAYKLPVICSSDCGTKSYIQGNGLVFQAKNTSSLINALRQCTRKQLQSWSKKSTELINKKHNPNNFTV